MWTTLLPRYRLWHAPAILAPAASMHPHIRCGFADLRRQRSGTPRNSRFCRSEPERPVLCSYPPAWFSICAAWTLVAWFITTRPKGQRLRSSATWYAYGDASRQRVSSSMSGTCRETRMPSPKGPISYGVHSRTEPSDEDVRLLRPEYPVERLSCAGQSRPRLRRLARSLPGFTAGGRAQPSPRPASTGSGLNPANRPDCIRQHPPGRPAGGCCTRRAGDLFGRGNPPEHRRAGSQCHKTGHSG
jgi:hypothetical protein